MSISIELNASSNRMKADVIRSAKFPSQLLKFDIAPTGGKD
jgi:hypothetical protein